MKRMSKWLSDALERLKKEEKEAAKVNRYTGVMTSAVKRQLEEFCRQDEEFSQAIVQGGSFTECMKAVTKNVGTSISDVEAYKRAVQFYFPGAEVRVKMWVDLVGQAKVNVAGGGREGPLGGGEETPEETQEKKPTAKILDLADFL